MVTLEHIACVQLLGRFGNRRTPHIPVCVRSLLLSHCSPNYKARSFLQLTFESLLCSNPVAEDVTMTYTQETPAFLELTTANQGVLPDFLPG